MGEKWMLGRQSNEYTPEGLIGFSNLADDPRSLWKDFFFFLEMQNKEFLSSINKIKSSHLFWTK